ncbi:hypothetical protein BDQ17DRAFT_1439630 [Cyathus striatus]|nr:hypothetical protein BDQ17DRAFT_1439630 [Cyathus striatus]
MSSSSRSTQRTSSLNTPSAFDRESDTGRTLRVANVPLAFDDEDVEPLSWGVSTGPGTGYSSFAPPSSSYSAFPPPSVSFSAFPASSSYTQPIPLDNPFASPPATQSPFGGAGEG